MKLLVLVLSIVGIWTTRAAPLLGYRLVFDDEFNTAVNVSNWGPIPPAKWIAHTPYNGDFGDAFFTNPSYEGGPFGTIGGWGLTIKAWYDSKTKHWRSGLLCSVDPRGHGFSQALGYWECRMKMPYGAGCAPAFWLLGINGLIHDGLPVAETDIVEWFSSQPNAVHYATGGKGIRWNYGTQNLAWALHTYACLINPDYTHFFFDDCEIGKLPTPPTGIEPMYCLIDFAMGDGWPITGATSPNYLWVNWVRCYAK